MRVYALILLLQFGSLNAAATDTSANPIRKVVTLMQNMQKEITAEGEKEQELFDKFMCFCGGSQGDLEKSAADSRAKIDELTARLQSETAEKTQTEQELGQHKQDREGATGDLKQATTIREKENSDFKAAEGDSKTNIAAMSGAVGSLEKGMGGASLMQLPHIDRVHKLIETYPNVNANDRSSVLAFLDQTTDYAPQGGQIVGIMKQMLDEMNADLKQSVSDEDNAAASFKGLKASKEEEVKLAGQAIETKTARAGELAVSVVQTDDALEDEKDELADAEKFVGNLKQQCATKQQEWDAIVKVRNDEVSAISEAIKILNDDDALEVFKKALPSSALQTGMSFLQRGGSSASALHKAQALFARVASQEHAPEFRLMLLSLTSNLKLQQKARTENFGKVIEMVDNMVTLLDKQQGEDDQQREFCNTEFDKAEDEEKATKAKIADLDAAISEMTDSATQLAEQIASLNAEILGLDKAVAEATEQRKAEHADYVQSQQMNGVAKQLVGKARNRMQKFYQPTLYKGAASFVQLSLKTSSKVAPPEAPEGPGPFKKNEGSAGVLGMMSEIIQDLEMTIKEGEYDEKTAQKDYNGLMGDSQQKRAENSKSITNKEAAKAQLETKIQVTQQAHSDTNTDLDNVHSVIRDLHASCDFLLQNYDVRKEARATERTSLQDAKAVLSGATF